MSMQELPEGLLEAVLGPKAKDVTRACIREDATGEDFVRLIGDIASKLGIEISEQDIVDRFAKFRTRNLN